MHLKILAAERQVFSGEVQALYAQGVEGWFGILPGHAPAAFALEDAPLRLVTESGERAFRVRAGLVHVRREGVVVLADEVTEVA
ncbi:TPA: F0F1 ATP synthase subunit epsilon [Candidatus Bipolaricaulota bacterium]|nr:F0F1 ATP synthase subunit epsilon [Candidatus Bipolaricaulota bacterium]HIQ00084.1 F0F1 ATP synthase subunit epsilon [Candidatus Bipolaricaulota bacterium]